MQFTRKKITAVSIFALIAFIVIYIFIALLPYTGSAFVSDKTINSFEMENFFGRKHIPEQVMLLSEPNEALFHRVNLISQAQERILLASYIIHKGISSDIIMGALLSAADRGVEIKIITDAKTGAMPARYRNVLARHDNISVYQFNPFNFFKPQYLNMVFHDKFMTVDNRFMLMGGRNIGDKYYDPAGYSGKLSLDKEVLVYNTDTDFKGSILEVTNLFFTMLDSKHAILQEGRNRNNDWEARKGYLIGLYDEYTNDWLPDGFDYLSNTVKTNRITLLSNPIESTKKESVVAYNLMMIAKNSDIIIAQSPYLVLTNRNLELFSAMVEGRNFTLSTNSLASTSNVPAFSNYYINRRNILKTGITIYEYQETDSSIHGKAFLFDGRLTAIGSFNLNERSIRSDTESVLVIDSEEFHYLVLESVNRYISRSLRVNSDNAYILSNYVEEKNVSWAKRLVYTIAGNILRGFRFMS